MKKFKTSTENCSANRDKIYFNDMHFDAWGRKDEELKESKGEIYDFIYMEGLRESKLEYFFIFLARLKV